MLYPYSLNRLIVRSLALLFIMAMTSCDGGVGGGNDDVSDGSGLLGSRNRISITGIIKAPGGAVTADNPIGLQAAPNKEVSLFRIDNQGHVIGDALDSSISDPTGHYVLVLPDFIGISSDLIVETRLENNRPARAIVIDEETDITPITEYITAKIIADPDLNLSSLPATEVIELVAFVETLAVTPQPDLASLLTEIALVSDAQINTEVGNFAVEFNPRVRLSGLLSIPVPALKNGIYALREVAAPNSTIFLYELDNQGNIVGDFLVSTTTGNDGRYELVLPEGRNLSSNLILRAEVDQGIYLNAFVSNVQLDINPISEYVYTRVANASIPLNEVSAANVHEMVTYISTLNIPEASTLAGAFSAIDSGAGIAINSQINDIQTSISAALGFFGSSIWDGSSYH